jgi:hypothetical protein
MCLRISIADAGFIFNLVGQQRQDNIERFSWRSRGREKGAAEIRLSEIVRAEGTWVGVSMTPLSDAKPGTKRIARSVSRLKVEDS